VIADTVGEDDCGILGSKQLRLPESLINRKMWQSISSDSDLSDIVRQRTHRGSIDRSRFTLSRRQDHTSGKAAYATWGLIAHREASHRPRLQCRHVLTGRAPFFIRLPCGFVKVVLYIYCGLLTLNNMSNALSNARESRKSRNLKQRTFGGFRVRLPRLPFYSRLSSAQLHHVATFRDPFPPHKPSYDLAVC